MGKIRIDVDRAEVERMYRAGSLSIREISRRHDISEGAIRKWAAELGWERDLAETVRASVREKVVRDVVREHRTPAINSPPPTDEEIVEQASDVGAAVVSRHRKDLAQLEGLRISLARKAEALIGQVDNVRGLYDAASAIESLARTIGRLIPLERQSYSIDDRTTNAGPTLEQLIAASQGDPT